MPSQGHLSAAVYRGHCLEGWKAADILFAKSSMRYPVCHLCCLLFLSPTCPFSCPTPLQKADLPRHGDPQACGGTFTGRYLPTFCKARLDLGFLCVPECECGLGTLIPKDAGRQAGARLGSCPSSCHLDSKMLLAPESSLAFSTENGLKVKKPFILRVLFQYCFFPTKYSKN